MFEMRYTLKFSSMSAMVDREISVVGTSSDISDVVGSCRIFAVGWKSRYNRSAGWREAGSLSITAERASGMETLLLAFVEATYRRFY